MSAEDHLRGAAVRVLADLRGDIQLAAQSISGLVDEGLPPLEGAAIGSILVNVSDAIEAALS